MLKSNLCQQTGTGDNRVSGLCLLKGWLCFIRVRTRPRSPLSPSVRLSLSSTMKVLLCLPLRLALILILWSCRGEWPATSDLMADIGALQSLVVTASFFFLLKLKLKLCHVFFFFSTAFEKVRTDMWQSWLLKVSFKQKRLYSKFLTWKWSQHF